MFWYFYNPLLCLLLLNHFLHYIRFLPCVKTPDGVRHRSGQWDHGHPGPGRWSGGHENQAGTYGGGDQPWWAACHCWGPGAFDRVVVFSWRAWEFAPTHVSPQLPIKSIFVAIFPSNIKLIFGPFSTISFYCEGKVHLLFVSLSGGERSVGCADERCHQTHTDADARGETLCSNAPSGEKRKSDCVALRAAEKGWGINLSLPWLFSVIAV